MASVPQAIVRLGLLLLGVTGSLATGCVGLSVQVTPDAPKGLQLPCEVAVCWKSGVEFAPDPAHGGQLTPGLVGRVFLFNQKRLPVEGDGSLHVELADGSVDPPKVLEQWNIDAVTLRKYLHRDWIGTGYSVFLPWGTYRKDLTHVVMRAAYQPVKGTPLYATPSQVALDGGSKNPMTAR